MARVKRVDNLAQGINLTPDKIGLVGPCETITQDRYEDIMFLENILFFIAAHGLAYVFRVQEDGSVVRGDPGEWVGYQHGVIDDSTCAYMTEL